MRGAAATHGQGALDGRGHAMLPQHREVSWALLIDTQNRFLFQQRDDVPWIIAPGKISNFGGHREGRETFLDCVVREVHEETGVALPPERFLHLASYRGFDPECEGGWLSGESYVVRDVLAECFRVTEGSLVVAKRSDLALLGPKFAPLARLTIEQFLGCSLASLG